MAPKLFKSIGNHRNGKCDKLQDEVPETPYLRLMRRYKWVKRILLPMLLIVLLILIYSASLIQLNYSLGLLMIVILFVFVPGLVLKSFRSWRPLPHGDAPASDYLIFIVSGAIHMIIYTNWLSAKELELYKRFGTITQAVVTAIYTSDDSDMEYEFSVDYRTYSTRASNLGHHLMGDTIQIIYNKNIPEMNEPIEIFNNNK